MQMNSAVAERMEAFMHGLERRNPGQPEYHQAVQEVAASVLPFIADKPHYQEAQILERMAEPDRVISFRVCWEDDSGNVRVNRGYRVQANNAIGPYKGGLRFHPTVNQSILKFLAFEQTFKNSLTGLPMGGAKGGANFNPKGKSAREVMRFCQAFMTELHRHIGADTDVPAGDIGVGGREIGYLFGQYKRLANEFTGVLTGKGLEYGGSLIRTEATGYGVVYFVQNILDLTGKNLDGRKVTISGAGNVALHAAEKAMELGAQVVTLSDSSGFVHDAKGIDADKLAFVKELKEARGGSLEVFAEEYQLPFHAGQRPWGVACELALPCATQNELNAQEARQLLDNGCMLVAEGANMPCEQAAVELFEEAGILFAPSKAANAGGVAVSGLEMSQNSARLSWEEAHLDSQLKQIMADIHGRCVRYGSEQGQVDYLDGANIAGFVKVADAMLAHGVI